MSGPMSKAMAETYAALMEGMTGDPVRLISCVHGITSYYRVERWTGTRWVSA